jgi:hypothetical protein
VTPEKWTTGELNGLKDKLGERIGATAKGIEILKMAVDPITNLAYFAVRKLDGKQDLILTVDANFGIGVLPLENIEYARIAIPSDKGSVTKITDLVWSGKSILVAAQANETFGSKILVAPAPIVHDAKGVMYSTETYHVAHGKWETKAPIRTIMPYQEKGKNYLVGAFTCTPIVKYAIDDLQPGAAVKGTSLIELGAGNTPQTMFSYEKNGKSFILMTTVRNNKVAVGAIGPSPYWTVKVDQNILTEDVKVNKDATWRDKSGVKSDRAQIVPEFHGVMLMDRLGTGSVLVVRQGKEGAVNLAVLPLP